MEGMGLVFTINPFLIFVFRNIDYESSLCQGFVNDPDSVSDAMKSFPSGHAQMSAFTATFVIVSCLIFFCHCLHLFIPVIVSFV